MIATYLKDTQTGRIKLNPARRYIQPFILNLDTAPATPEYDDAGLAIAARGIWIPPSSQSAPVPSTVGQEGPFEGFSLVHRRSNNDNVQGGGSDHGHRETTGVLVKITDGGSRRTYMNDWIHCDLFMGVGGFPFILPRTIMLEENRALIWQCKSLDDTNGIWFYPGVIGRRFYRQSAPPASLDRNVDEVIRRQQIEIPYFMTFDNISSAGAIEVPGNTRMFTAFITIDSSGHFDWHKTMMLATEPFQLDFEVRDPETGRMLMTSNTFAQLGGSVGAYGAQGTYSQIEVPGGTGQLNGLTPACAPAIWPEPLFCSRNMKLEFRFNNYDAATNYIKICLAGTRIFLK